MSAHLFIRNDDVWTLDREFRFFYDQAIERGIPVVHAVIPGKMDMKLVRFLCRAKEKTPHLLDIVQHGWIHANHSLEIGKKYEFGVSRSLKCQREDIQKGLKKMRLSFGACMTFGFVPPYHGVDDRTLRVLHEEGFQILSSGVRRSQEKKSFIEVPVQVSFSQYGPRKTGILNAQQVMEPLLRGVYRRSLSGVVTHHKDFVGSESRRTLVSFLDMIAALRAKKSWRVLLFSEILSGLKKG